MNAVTRLSPAMTRDEFLAWEGHARGRFEFDGQRPVAMTGGSPRHGQIISQLIFSVLNALDRKRWNVMTDAGVAVPDGGMRYPDALIAPFDDRRGGKLVLDPVVVFEVLSPSTVTLDKVVKLREYGGVPTIMRYVLVDQDTPTLLVLHRTSPSQSWSADGLTLGDTLNLTEIGASVSVSDIFAGLYFEPAVPDPRET